MMPLNYLDDLVWQQILELLRSPELIRTEIERRRVESLNTNPTQQRKEQLDRELTRAEEQMNKLLDAYQEDVLSLSELRERAPALRKKIAALQSEKQNLRVRAIEDQRWRDINQSLETFVARLNQTAQSLTNLEKQKIVRLLIKQIDVGTDTVTGTCARDARRLAPAERQTPNTRPWPLMRMRPRCLIVKLELCRFFMKTSPKHPLISLACVVASLSFSLSVPATQVLVSSFDNNASTNGWYYQNWNSSVGVFSWAAGPAGDAQGSATSGSLEMRTQFGGTNNGGAYRLPVNNLNGSAYTALEYDAKVDPASPLDKYGNASDFKVGVFTTGSYNYHALDYNLAPVSTNNGWQHFVVPASSIGGTEWGDIKEVFIQQYDNNYTNAATAVTYIDNIRFIGPDPTYPNFVSPTLQFNDPSSVAAINNNYGNTTTFSWSPNDAKGLTNSGSLYVVANFQPGGNNDVLFIPFDTNYVVQFSGPDTNVVINARQYTNIEFDVMWDTTNSTIPLSEFNSAGDISGFPLGLLCNTATADQDQEEACGSSTTPVPDAATNGWVHMSCPINQNQANIDKTVGLWFKKYAVASLAPGTAAFWVDNFVFDGARIAKPVPTMTLSKAAPGLQINFTGTGNNPPYDRENLVTAASTYSFVDSPSPVTYSLTYGEFAPSTYSLSGQITFVPTSSGATGTETEPDWVDSTVFKISLSRNGLGSQVTLQAKTNAPNDNGSLYIAGNPTWVSRSPIEGKWSFTFSGNTNIQATAPDGSSTNLVFPLGLTSSEVSSLFSGGAFVYFGGECGGSAGEGGRIVIQNISISGGSATALSDNFLADTNLDLVSTGGTLWNNATDTATRSDGVYLLGPGAYWLDWTVNGGPGWLIETNGNLASPNWSTNVPWSSVLDASHFHSDLTNAPPGPLFFRLALPQ